MKAKFLKGLILALCCSMVAFAVACGDKANVPKDEPWENAEFAPIDFEIPSTTINGIVYGLSDDSKYLEVVGCDKNIEHAVIIDSYGGLQVKKVSSSAFMTCTNLKSVSIPDSVEEIEFSAFSYCDNLKEVTVGKGLRKIGSGALISTSLERVNYGGSLSEFCSIEGSFSNSQNGYDLYIDGTLVTEVVIPNTVTKIGGAFNSCKSITRVVIPDSVVEIGNSAFSNCRNLIDVEISDSVIKMGSSAFLGTAHSGEMSNWDVIQSGENVKRIAYYVGNHLIKVDGAGTRCTLREGTVTIASLAFNGMTNINLETVVLPDGLKSIGDGAFNGEVKLVNINIPTSVEYIGKRAFYKTAFYNASKNWQGGALYVNNVLVGVNAVSELNVKEGTTSVVADLNNTGVEKINIPASVVYIDSIVFNNSAQLKEISVDEQNPVYKSINGHLYTKDGSVLIKYAGGKESSEYVMPATVTRVEDDAFALASNLKVIELGESIDQFPSMLLGDTSLVIRVNKNNQTYTTFNGNVYTKNGCVLVSCHNSRENVVIGDTVKKIGDYAFDGNETIKTVKFNSAVTVIGSYSFAGCVNIRDLVIPGNVLAVEVGAFSGCTGIRTLNLNSGVAILKFYAFSECSGIKTIYFPSTIINVDSSFSYTPQGNIRDVYFDGTLIDFYLTYSDNDADVTSSPLFGGAKLYLQGELLTEIVMPDNVYSVYAGAFAYCTSLQKVVLGKNVKTIGARALYNCTNLKEVVMNDCVELIEYDAFAVTGIDYLVIPSSVKFIRVISSMRVPVYCYEGSKEEFMAITDVPLGKDAEIFYARNCYYSEEEPNLNEGGTDYDGRYWHYGESGEIVLWEFAV